MWQKNARWLRSCSSPRSYHGHGPGHALSRRLVPLRPTQGIFRTCAATPFRFAHTQAAGVQDGGAIGEDEFLRALGNVLPPSVERHRKPATVGLAVSGGVDSMALATLYAKYRHKGLPELHGFIIDHKARPESAEEARWVADQLSKLGIQSTIIPLTWPKGLDLEANTRFETEARTLRYQALGRACRAHDIKSLMIAHHADDQAETLLMRVLHGRLRSGLQGMKAIEWIPECYGIHGVYHSGGPVPKGDHNNRLVEHGGIRILRPLLDFGKSRLIATCQEHEMPWAEDKTNHDKTLTLRNALRFVMKNHRLPAALSNESLLALAQTTRARVERHRAAAEAIFDTCPIKLTLSTGIVTVRLPPAEAMLPDPTAVPSESDKLYARNTAHHLLQRIADLVSPMEKSPVETIANAVLTIYPSLTPSSLPTRSPQSTFSCANCWWIKNTTASSLLKPAPPPGSLLNEWTLARLPPSKAELPSLRLSIPPSTSSSSPNRENKNKQKPEFHLFDNRHWIRVFNPYPRPVVLKMLSAAQLETLLRINPNAKFKGDVESEEGVLHERYRGMSERVHAVRPHAVRRGVVGLFLEAEGGELDEELLGVPMLGGWEGGKGGRGRWRGKRMEGGCGVEVRYRKVDSGGRMLGDIVG